MSEKLTKAQLIDKLVEDGIIENPENFKNLSEKQLLELVETKEKQDDFKFDLVIEKLKEEGSETLANKLNTEIVKRRQAEQKTSSLKQDFKNISDKISEVLK